jgi:serine/threonine-protein kinase
MTDSLERLALDAFASWLDGPVETRDEALEERLDDQPGLRDRVRRLIRSHAQAALLPTEVPAAAQPPPSWPTWPDRVGAYRIAELIGEGGMGLVFRAERDDGLFNHSVAIKLIRRSLFAASAAEQFALERQILATLRHPHIAQLLDGGVTAAGDPYIVMELIEGVNVVEHCDANGIDRGGRVAILREVCEAVQFAHQNLIVHADIKPSNVVIDRRHGVKLLDFGIARLLDGSGTDSSSTNAARTPAFASPARIAGQPAVPADDMFALGRLAADLIGTAPPPQLAAVIARAVAPSPTDRYGAVAQFSADLGRWLEGKPVSAAPASGWRVAWMFARRHPVSAVATASAVATLVAALGVTSGLYLRAEQARRSAEARFAEVRQLSGYLLTDLTDRLEGLPGASSVRHDLAAKGRSYLETLGKLPDAPVDLRLEIARGYTTTAKILGQPNLQNLGDPQAAQRDLGKAEAILSRLRAEHGDQPTIDLALSEALSARAAIVHVTNNSPAAAERLYRSACILADRAAGAGPETAVVVFARTKCQMGVATIEDYEARYQNVHAPLDAVFAALNANPTLDPVNANLTRGSALILKGDFDYFSAKDKLAALADYRAAVKAFATGSATEAADARLLERQAWAYWNVAATLEELERPKEALSEVDRGIADAHLMLAFEKSPRAWHIANILDMERGFVLALLHRYPEAFEQADAGLRGFQAAAARAPHDFEAARAVPVSMRPLGEMYWAAGRHAQACAIFRDTSRLWARLQATQGVTGYDPDSEIEVVRARLERCRHDPAIGR